MRLTYTHLSAKVHRPSPRGRLPQEGDGLFGEHRPDLEVAAERGDVLGDGGEVKVGCDAVFARLERVTKRRLTRPLGAGARRRGDPPRP